MERYIAYFDYLGFKDFIENNDIETHAKIMHNNFRDIESALAHGKIKETTHGLIPDISKSSINCINFSDTVIFFTNDKNETSLIELLQVAYRFNWQCIAFCFPVRGAVVMGELVKIDFSQTNQGGGVYNINSVFGKGLVYAHKRAESQDWAGTIVDESVVHEIEKSEYKSADEILKMLASKFKVPYKCSSDKKEEYVFNLVEGSLNPESFKNMKNHISNNFAQYNKKIDDERVQIKISNTIKFLQSFLQADPSSE